MDGRVPAVASLQRSANGAWHGGLQSTHDSQAATSQAGGTSLEDLDTLLLAIEARLRTTVGDDGPAAGPGQVRRTVLECVEALEHLHAGLGHERLRHARAQQAASSLQARLSQALKDLAATQAERERARHCALHDELTSLPNRSYFREQLDRALRGPPQAAPGLAVLYLDLDGMKTINDTHGHCIGDQLLVVVASRLVRTLRSTDIVSRLGGDEFALLLADLPCAQDVGAWAARLGAAISAPVQLGTLQLHVRASIGIAMCPEHGNSATALIDNADRAMYRAKRRRSGHEFFDRSALA